jgi:CHAD domain-containing protein
MDEEKENLGAITPLVEQPVPHPAPRRTRRAENPVTPATGQEWDRVRALARKQLDRFMSLESKVLRNSSPEDIHDIRVASRRLQQVVDLLYPQPRPREIRKLRRVMKRCRGALSDVRNCDVLLEQVKARLARKRTTRREVWEAVDAYLEQRRSDNFEKALRKLSKVNMAVVYVSLRKHLNGNGAASDHHHDPPAAAASNDLGPKQFYERVGQSLEKVSQAFQAQIAQSHHDRRASVIHGARIATKRLRYSVEVIREFGVPGSDETLAWLRDLQQLLGDWHDQEVLEELMIEMVARPEFLREHLDLAMGVEKLILQVRKGKKLLEEKYVEITKDSPAFRRVRNWVVYVLASPSAAFATA